LIDLKERYESIKRRNTTDMMKHGLESAGLVILRDTQSFDSIRHFIGDTDMNVLIGADPAIEIIPKSIGVSRIPDEVKAVCHEGKYKIGICLSAQSPVRQMNELAAMFDRLVESRDIKIIGIPMNPITDAQLMNDFRGKLKCSEVMCVAEGRLEPDEVAGLASEMDVVISSRLHLLILASITFTPFIGISRGSKITNFTSQFQLPEIGSVDTIDIRRLEDEIIRLFSQREDFEKIAREVREEMLKRLALAKSSLAGLLVERASPV
jgi:polysaccharide pyruvyl transferase WcaK-like protein